MNSTINGEDMFLRHLWKLLGLFCLTACGEDPFNRDPQKTQIAMYAQTQTALELFEPTRVALQSTADAAPLLATQSAYLTMQNLNLQATMTAYQMSQVQPAQLMPTPTLDGSQISRAGEHYQNVTTASGVYDADGCAMDKKDTFYISGADDPTRIYFTTLATDVIAGTTYQTRWSHGANVRYESITWTADQNYDEICIYFWLESSYTPYEGGFWLVELLANGAYATGTRFAMCEPGLLC